MSMHLVKPYLTTTSYKKRKIKITKSKQEELEQGWRDRNKELKKLELPKETFEQYLEWVYGTGKKKIKKEKDRSTYTPPKAQVVEKKFNNESGIHKNLSQTEKIKIRSEDFGCAFKSPTRYTGTKILGIGTMHKSNMVPIFSDEEAKDISKMRR
jgi:hypothetical protein